MMFEYMGWIEAARMIEDGMEKTIVQKRVTYDFERVMQGATKLGPANLPRRLSRTCRPELSVR